MNGKSFGKSFLWWLTVMFLFASLLAGVAMAVLGVTSTWKDIQLSVAPMLTIGMSSVVAWGLSVLSTVSEIMGGLFLLDLSKIVQEIKRDPFYAMVSPLLNEKTIQGAKIFFLMMAVYDLATNVYGAYLESPNIISVVITSLALWLAEYFTIIGAAFALAVIEWGGFVLGQIRPVKAVKEE